jgi:hypothetical protein
MIHSGLLLVFYDPKASNGALDWIDPALWSVETAVFPWKYLVENRISGALVSKFRASKTRGVVLKPAQFMVNRQNSIAQRGFAILEKNRLVD